MRRDHGDCALDRPLGVDLLAQDGGAGRIREQLVAVHHEVRVEDQPVVGRRVFAQAASDVFELTPRAIDRLHQALLLEWYELDLDAMPPHVAVVGVDHDRAADVDPEGGDDAAVRDASGLGLGRLRLHR